MLCCLRHFTDSDSEASGEAWAHSTVEGQHASEQTKELVSVEPGPQSHRRTFVRSTGVSDHGGLVVACSLK